MGKRPSSGLTEYTSSISFDVGLFLCVRGESMSAYTAVVVYDACSITDGSIYETTLVALGAIAGMAIGMAIMIAITRAIDKLGG